MSPTKVPKAEVSVVIYTSTHKIEGIFHARERVRLLDELNLRQEDFIPLTGVKIANLLDEGKVLFESDFMAINKNRIVVFCENPKTLEGAQPAMVAVPQGLNPVSATYGQD